MPWGLHGNGNKRSEIYKVYMMKGMWPLSGSAQGHIKRVVQLIVLLLTILVIGNNMYVYCGKVIDVKKVKS